MCQLKSAPYSAPLANHRRITVDILGYGLSDRPQDFPYTMTEHVDAVAQMLHHADVASVPSMGGAIAVHVPTTIRFWSTA